jgi:hypothetical protein
MPADNSASWVTQFAKIAKTPSLTQPGRLSGMARG